MTQTVRLLLLAQGASFILASLVHRGYLVAGYAHDGAVIPETVIGAVLLAGLALTYALPDRARAIGLAVQGFALLGTLVGVTLVAVGVGPRTVPDVVYHSAILAALVWGLGMTVRASKESFPG